jgi:murein DD-endopeptidase MepM/ murein hydrolase activator NlpD
MKMLFRALLALCYLVVANVSATNQITMQPAPDVIAPGEAVTLDGNQRFNPGQLNNLFFFVGTEMAKPIVVNANRIRLVIPAVEPGLQTIRVIKHDSIAGRDIIEFAADIQVDGERILSSVVGSLSPGGGRFELPGVARVELTEDRARPTVRLTIEHVVSRSEARLFRSYLESEKIPAIATDTFVRVLTSSRIDGFAGLRLRIPEAIRTALGPGLEPELYAEVPSLSETEDNGEYRPLHAEYNAETGELSAPFSGAYFNDLADSASTTQSIATLGFQFSGRIRISVRPIGSRHAPVTATVAFPNAPQIEAGARDILQLRAKLLVGVPISLRNPASYGGPHTPETTSLYSSAHGGLDIRSRDGDPVYAAADGIVSRIFNNMLPGHPRCNPTAQRGGGWSIAINHVDGTRTSYSHLIVGSELVTEGQVVTAGQQIAKADHTGGTCPSGLGGAHLHLGYRIDGLTTNPLPYIQTDPAIFEQQWLDQLSVIAVVDGSPIEETRKPVSAKEFEFAAPLDLSRLDLQPNRTYPLSLRLVTKDGQSADFYSGTLKIRTTALRVVVTWDKPDTDVDLHLMDSNGNEAWFRDLTGIPGGFLDHDDVDGFGPEVFTLDKLEADTTYGVSLHYYSDNGNGPTTAKVVVYLNNLEVTNTDVPLSNGQLLSVGMYSNTPDAAP